jgi:hypothetical protein
MGGGFNFSQDFISCNRLNTTVNVVSEFGQLRSLFLGVGFKLAFVYLRRYYNLYHMCVGESVCAEVLQGIH